MTARVALVKCESYDSDELQTQLSLCLEKMGGLASYIKPGQRVLLKPNIIAAEKPEKAVTTHPEFIRAVAREVRKLGAEPFIAENPAFVSPKKAFSESGLQRIMTEENLQLAEMQETQPVFYEGSRTFKKVEISKIFLEADVIINLPKFKTHGLTYITGAVKNLFGTIPGLEKSKWHFRAPTRETFAAFIVDLYELLQNTLTPGVPIIHIMDAIIGLEGEGPGASGKPKPLGAILAGIDGVALDSLMSHIVGLDLTKIHTCQIAQERGLGVAEIEKIEVIGNQISDFAIKNFQPTQSTLTSDISRWHLDFVLFKNMLIERPVINAEKCTACYRCVTICPAEALMKPEIKKAIPDRNYSKCIRCYCCQEICPEWAILLKQGAFGFLFRWAEKVKEAMPF